MRVQRDATAKEYGHLLFDLHPRTPDNVRLKSCLLHQEGPTVVYRQKEEL